jgi:hypothetical protein
MYVQVAAALLEEAIVGEPEDRAVELASPGLGRRRQW